MRSMIMKRRIAAVDGVELLVPTADGFVTNRRDADAMSLSSFWSASPLDTGF